VNNAIAGSLAAVKEPEKEIEVERERERNVDLK